MQSIYLKEKTREIEKRLYSKTSARMISIQEISLFCFYDIAFKKRLLVYLLVLLNIYASNSMHYFRRWPCSSSQIVVTKNILAI